MGKLYRITANRNILKKNKKLLERYLQTNQCITLLPKEKKNLQIYLVTTNIVENCVKKTLKL